MMEVVIPMATGFSSAHKRNGSDFKVPFSKNVNNVREQREPVEIAFENLDYSVPMGFKKEKEILHQVSGRFPPGQLIAILGPSGSGKTTLLEILSGYKISKTLGQIYTNEEVRNLQKFRKKSTYIPQEDRLQTLLTVWENMRIATDLKLGSSISNEEKETLIKRILSKLFLDKSAHIRTGYLSGGQQKRLSIALELINNPMVMFFDEPTTGLDSYSGSQCIELLQRLTKQGKTIICTIHQPSAWILQLFDLIYVLAKGNCLYQGTPDNLIHFLEHVNAPCPTYYNPADYIVELASEEYASDRITVMIETIRNGKCLQWFEQQKKLNILSISEPQKPIESQTQKGHKRQNPENPQLKLLVKREFLKCQRNTTLTHMRLIVGLFTSLLYGILYWQSGTHAGKVRNNYSLLFCVLIYHMMSTMMLGIISVPAELPILIREHFNRWYTLKAYFISTFLIETLVLIFSCLLFTVIVYFMTGQPLEFQRMAMFAAISVLVVLNSHSVGLLIGIMFDVVNGTFVGFSVSVVIMLLGGFGESLKYLPVNLNLISYGSYMKFGFDGIVSSIYGFGRTTIYCPEDDFCPYKHPKKLLKEIEINGEEFWTDIVGLCTIFCITRLSAFFLLKLRLNCVR